MSRPRNVWEDKWLAYALGTEGMALYEAKVASLKQELFREISSAEDATVVEGGIGAGANLPYFPHSSGTRVIGLEPNREMAKECMQRASAMQISLQLEAIPLGEGFVPQNLHDVVCV